MTLPGHRIAEAGRLRVSEERAAQLVHAAGTGTTLTLIAQPEDRRDLGLSAAAREAVIAAITTDAPAGDAGPVSAAVRTSRRARSLSTSNGLVTPIRPSTLRFRACPDRPNSL